MGESSFRSQGLSSFSAGYASLVDQQLVHAGGGNGNTGGATTSLRKVQVAWAHKQHTVSRQGDERDWQLCGVDNGYGSGLHDYV